MTREAYIGALEHECIDCTDCPINSSEKAKIILAKYDGCCEFNEMSDDELATPFNISNIGFIGGDPINHPAHYNDGKIEVIDYIEDKKLGFCLGNAVKYISRAGKKDSSKEVEDLKKAAWYIERRIKELQEVDE